MKLIGLIRLGRDAEVRYLQDGTPVANFSGAFNYGRKGDDGRRPSQWVDFALWGQRAEALAPYLTKGSLVNVMAGDPHMEAFEKRDGGQGFKIVARVDDLELAGGGRQEAADEPRSEPTQPARQAAAPKPAARPAPKQRPLPGNLQDMDDDIPF